MLRSPVIARGHLRSGSRLSGFRIVLVDDNDDARDLAAYVMRCNGADVEDASSANEAYARVLATAPHILVSDISMPNEDGYSLIRRIRLLPGDIGLTPALALSAFGAREDRFRALAAGFDLHMAKGLSIDLLIGAIRRLVLQRVSGIHQAVVPAPLSTRRS